MPPHTRQLEIRGIEDLVPATGGNREFQPVQMGRRPVRGNLAATHVGGVTLTYGKFHSDIKVSGTWSNSRVTIGVLLAADGVTCFGTDAQTGDLVVAGAAQEIDTRYRDTVEYVALNITRSDVLAEVASRGWILDERILDGCATFSLDSCSAGPLTDRMRRIEQAMRSGHLDEMGRVAEDHLGDALRTAFVGALIHSSRNGTADCASASPPLVHEVEQWLAEDPPRSCRVPDVARKFEVSPRHLYRAFKTEVGMSPARYLKRYRMTQARLALVEAAPSATTVTQVARTYGFFDPGRFAVEYRELFGEIPSRTLRRFEAKARARR